MKHRTVEDKKIEARKQTIAKLLSQSQKKSQSSSSLLPKNKQAFRSVILELKEAE